MIEVQIEGPGKNALSSAVMGSLLERLRAAGGEPVLLTGAGDAFSAGLNLKEVVGLDAAGMERFLRLLGELTTALFTYPGPTVALVEGHAIAGGCVLALCCDWRVGKRGGAGRIGLNEAALGLRFPGGLLRVLRHQVPRLDRVVLEAGLHPPERALELGLLDELADDARAVAVARLEALAAHPRAGYAATKRDLRERVAAIDPAEERRFLSEVLPVWTSEEVKARIRAVLKK